MYVVVERYAQSKVFGALDCQLFAIDQNIGSSCMWEFIEERSVRSFGLYLCHVCVPVFLSFEAFTTKAVEVVECCHGAFL